MLLNNFVVLKHPFGLPSLTVCVYKQRHDLNRGPENVQQLYRSSYVSCTTSVLICSAVVFFEAWQCMPLMLLNFEEVFYSHYRDVIIADF